MDVAGLQGIAGDLKWSAQAVNDSARRVFGAAQSFDATCAGRAYSVQGGRVATALEGVALRLFAWANCVDDTGGALSTAAAGITGVDQSVGAAVQSAAAVRV
ncbi:hypothetical protein NDR87_19470 [Nocardia sp. CDC159]|uniref:Excreted virulence factor EspC (Type VII ESX diderm) n=1 Tax=Nocardia pulmonis TaxID=2951408 RepID=A0A9X2E890_9NOCA|nr:MULTISPECIES: hypothetical protein [Nocardia]MCM6776127.1 hypothetical protein [Nocardia pulmonis]MCM6788546.1 hypothetical protein [Nocardia sp. CDC159]